MEFLSINERKAINVADVRTFATWFDLNGQPIAQIDYIGGRTSPIYQHEDARAIHWYVSCNAIPAYEVAKPWMTLEGEQDETE